MLGALLPGRWGGERLSPTGILGIILGANGLGHHEALLKDLEAGWERVVPVSELVQVIASLDARPPS
jgi:hypothetical protein